MIVVIPNTAYGHLGAVLSALIIVFALIGLTLHKDVYANRPRRDFYAYYTNLSNLLVLLYFSLVAPPLYASHALRPLIPHIEFCLTLGIMLTHLVFHFLLFPDVRAQYLQMPPSRDRSIILADNALTHYLVPWLVLLYWLLCAPGKQTLLYADALLWTIVPLLYLTGIFLRARCRGNIQDTDSPYPYPFLDVSHRGKRRVFFTCFGLFAVCVGSGAALVTVTRLAFLLFGDGHMLLLI